MTIRKPLLGYTLKTDPQKRPKMWLITRPYRTPFLWPTLKRNMQLSFRLVRLVQPLMTGTRGLR